MCGPRVPLAPPCVFLGLVQRRARVQPERSGSFDVVLLLLCLAVILDAHTELPYDFEDTLREPR